MEATNWTVEHSPERASFIRTGDERYKIVISGPHWTDPEREAIASMIVRSVNLHDELVLCCKIARSELTRGTPGGITDALWRLDAVLKKAEEQRT